MTDQLEKLEGRKKTKQHQPQGDKKGVGGAVIELAWEKSGPQAAVLTGEH